MKAPSPCDLLAVLFCPEDDLIELRALPSKDQAFIKQGDIVSVHRFVEQHSSDNIYLGISTRKDDSSGGLHNCSTVRALWADIDFKDFPSPEAAKLQLDAFPMRPSVVVNSGGGLHVYWLLKHAVHLHPENAEVVRDTLRRIAQAVGGDMSSAEPARILRLTGTPNMKYEHRPIVAVQDQSEARYDLHEFFSLPEIPEPEPPPAVKPNGRDQTGTTPGDDFAAKTPWQEILEASGAKLSHRAGDTEYWTRPGKKVHDGHSASTNHDGHDLLYVFTDGWPPFEPNKGYGKFTAYTYLNHGGDFSAAARELASRGFGVPKINGNEETPCPDEQYAPPPAPGDDSWEVKSEASAGNDSAEKQKQQITVIESLPEFAARVSQLPKLKTYVPDLVYEDKTGLTHGQPRDGKSLFELEVALTAAIGGCVLGLERFRVLDPVSVCYLTEEDSEREVLKRITWLLAGKGVSKLPENFFLAVRRGIDIDEFKWQRYLIGAAKDRGFKFLIIDPLRAFTAHADQGPSELKPVSLFIRRFMNETGCSHRVVHHDGKPQAGKPDERKRPQRASGGGIFSISDCPLSFQRISRNKTMVVPSGYKFTDDPQPFKFTLEKNDGKDTEWIRLVGESVTPSADDTDLEKFEAIKEALKKQPGLSGRKVSEAAGIRKDDCNALLEKLLGLNEVDLVKKGTAKLWFLPGT